MVTPPFPPPSGHPPFPYSAFRLSATGLSSGGRPTPSYQPRSSACSIQNQRPLTTTLKGAYPGSPQLSPWKTKHGYRYWRTPNRGVPVCVVEFCCWLYRLTGTGNSSCKVLASIGRSHGRAAPWHGRAGVCLYTLRCWLRYCRPIPAPTALNQSIGQAPPDHPSSRTTSLGK